jgi:DNA-binding IscR family transcriptional regulator
MHNGSCEGVEMEGKHCSLHHDYEKSRKELIKLFSNRTIHELVIKSKNPELITI